MPHPLLFIWQGSAEGGGGSPEPTVSKGGAWAHLPMRDHKQIRGVDFDVGSVIVEPGQTKDDS